MPSYYDDAAAVIRRLLGYGDEVAAAAPARFMTGGARGQVRVDEAGWPLGTSAWAAKEPTNGSLDNIVAGAPEAAPDMSLGSSTWGQMSSAADKNAQLVRGQSANLRNQPFAGIAGQAAREANDAAKAAIQRTFDNRDMVGRVVPAAGAVAGAAGVGALSNALKSDSVAKAPAPEGVTSTAGTADLVNESRPAPVVTPDENAEQAFTEKFKRQYTARENKREAKGQGGYANKPQAPAQKSDPRSQAQAMIDDLNERRRKAGREVPEAPQMMAQINQLLEQSNQAVNSRSLQQAQAHANQNPNDPHAQAAALISQLNEMRRQAGREVPQAPQIMAEVRRLQAMGDQQRNAQTTARRK
jgi:hypothetical protein